MKYKTKAIEVEAIQWNHSVTAADLPEWATDLLEVAQVWPQWWLVKAGDRTIVICDADFRALIEVTP